MYWDLGIVLTSISPNAGRKRWRWGLREREDFWTGILIQPTYFLFKSQLQSLRSSHSDALCVRRLADFPLLPTQPSPLHTSAPLLSSPYCAWEINICLSSKNSGLLCPRNLPQFPQAWPGTFPLHFHVSGLLSITALTTHHISLPLSVC